MQLINHSNSGLNTIINTNFCLLFQSAKLTPSA